MDLSAFTLAGADSLAEVSELVTGCSVDWQAGAVAELRLTLADRGRVLAGHGLLELGAELTWGGTVWQLGSVDRNLAAWGADVECRFRSQLGKTLRASTGTSSTKNVSPGEWIERKVKALGGRAVVERGAKRRTIVQKRGQTALDVVTGLASTMGTEWVEADGLLVVGTPWWAWSDGPGLPTWSVTWQTAPETDAVALSATVSEDDRANGATASITVPRSIAEPIRPWHRVELSGAGEPLDGTWLVGSVALELASTEDVTLELSRPLRTSPKRGSAKASAGKVSTPAVSKPGTAPKPSASQPGKSTRGAKAKLPAPVSRAPRTPSRGTSSAPSYSGAVHRPYAGVSRPTTYDGHGGALDFPMPRGTALYAARSGYVISCRGDVPNHARGGPANKWPGAANYVLLGVMFEGKPARILYWHMSPGLAVRRGQWVKAGQYLGRSGNTGHTTGDHLHIQAAWGHQDSTFGGPIIYPPTRLWA